MAKIISSAARTQTTTPTNTRKEYIDTARGIGLILLVLGHILTPYTYLYNWIYSFHMPLFFFLSGMVANEKRLNHFPSYLKKKASARLIPYFVIVLLAVIICFVIPSYRNDLFANVTLTKELSDIFWYCRPTWLYVGQVWFLVALFWSEIYFYGWHKLVGKRNFILQILVALIFVVLSRHIWKLDPYVPFIQKIPFLLDVACMGSFCYILGFMVTKYRLIERLNKWVSLLLIPVLFAINIYFGTYSNGYVNMVDLVFVNALRYVPAMIAGVLSILLVARFLEKIPCLKWMGKYSLPLFASHTFLIYLVREVVYWITGTHYTMMYDVPTKLAFLMTLGVLILFIPVGYLYIFLQKKSKAIFSKSNR
ncbi:MAG: acyltransferase family protein [Lachnospiraceae bacterium]|nr:acyltransferase family protein [Lachnospiraceae bacterium]